MGLHSPINNIGMFNGMKKCLLLSKNNLKILYDIHFG